MISASHFTVPLNFDMPASTVTLLAEMETVEAVTLHFDPVSIDTPELLNASKVLVETYGPKTDWAKEQRNRDGRWLPPPPPVLQ